MIVNKPLSTYLISSVLIVLGVLCLLGITKKFETPKRIPFGNVEIGYDSKSLTSIRDHAIKIDQGKFLLAVGNPSELDLALKFSSSHKVSLDIKPLYPNWICKEKGVNQAYLSLTSDRFDEKWRLVKGRTIVIDTNVHDGERLRVSITNSHQHDCGRAEVTIDRVSHHMVFLGVFFLIWSLIFVAFIYYKIPIVFSMIGMAVNLLIIYANATLDYLAFDFSSNALALSVSSIGMLVLLHCLNVHRYVKGIFSTILILSILITPILYIGNYLLFAVPVSNETIHALWQSDVQEILEFIETYVGLWSFLPIIAALFVLLKCFSLVAYSRPVLPRVIFGLGMLIPAVIVAPHQLSANPMVKTFSVGTSEYFSELSDYKEWKALRKTTESLPDAKLIKSGHTAVVILGESANRNHMSLYGYPRDTTPNADALLSNDELIRFSRAYASYTHTGAAVAHALTQADQYTKTNWTSAPSIISLANSLGVETTWITNQQTFGAWDNQVSILAEDADTIISKNKKIGTGKDASKYDGAMLPALAEALKENSPNKLIVMHLQGSHASYCRRFPDSHAPFYNRPLSKSGFGGLASASNYGVVNCYDNSIYYTDQVIKDVMSLLGDHDDPASLLYFSDHSEDVFGGKAHNSSVFIYEMVEIPMYFWANDKWKKTFSNLWENLSINSEKIFTNDHIFETLSGVLGIESKEINVANDLSSTDFKSAEQPLTLLGKKKIASDDNWRYWQRENAKNIFVDRQCSRLLPHRANTIGKIRTALDSGLCGFEIDVLLNDDVKNPFFSVGHDAKSLTDINLDSVLAAVSYDQASKIWLDIKNVNKEKIPLIIKRLDYLDKKYNLKSKTIVETSYFGEKVQLIADAGYQLSYYLPTGAVIHADSKSDEDRNRLAKELGKRIRFMRASAISFDLKLYWFVKNYLEPSIPADIDYHTWFPSGLKFSTLKLTQELSNREYYKDLRVKTILIPYHSPFQY